MNILLGKDPLKRYFNSYKYNIFRNVYVIGITGSCGKTSTTLYLYNFLKYYFNDVCYIGTHKIYYNDIQIETKNTTLEINILKEYFDKYNINPKIIVMEVSSIGINEARINNFKFNILALTNLGRDHLDYHLNISNYHNVKLSFLNSCLYSDTIFINEKYKNKYNFTNRKIVFFKYDELLINQFDTINFNKENMYLSYLILKELRFNENEIIKNLNNIKLNNGRAEIIHYNNRKIIIDYAHHVESFEVILNDGNYNKVVIFGCGGNRDKDKRNIMGTIAEKYCKHVFITQDNSRNENVFNIINDITRNISNYKIIINRDEAINYVLDNFPNMDIYILGKGDEIYIEENNNFIKFNDKDCVLKYIKNHTI